MIKRANQIEKAVAAAALSDDSRRLILCRIVEVVSTCHVDSTIKDRCECEGDSVCSDLVILQHFLLYGIVLINKLQLLIGIVLS